MPSAIGPTGRTWADYDRIKWGAWTRQQEKVKREDDAADLVKGLANGCCWMNRYGMYDYYCCSEFWNSSSESDSD